MVVISGVCQTGLGFNYDWETQYTITGINENGPADKILQNGDRIVKV